MPTYEPISQTLFHSENYHRFPGKGYLAISIPSIKDDTEYAVTIGEIEDKDVVIGQSASRLYKPYILSSFRKIPFNLPLAAIADLERKSLELYAENFFVILNKEVFYAPQQPIKITKD